MSQYCTLPDCLVERPHGHAMSGGLTGRLEQPNPNEEVPSVTTGGTEAAKPESRCTCRPEVTRIAGDESGREYVRVLRCDFCKSMETSVTHWMAEYFRVAQDYGRRNAELEATADALQVKLHAALARAQQAEETIERLRFERRKC